MIRPMFLATIASLGSACSDEPIDQLELPGSGYFPESLHAAADGTIYVGSLGTGQIVRFPPHEADAEVVVAPASDRNIAGVLVDDTSASVLACTGSIASFGRGNRITRFASAGGAAIASYPLPDGAFCNDMTFDHDHHLYIADSIGGRIFKLARGSSDGTAPAMWASDPLLLGPAQGQLGADGIAYDGSGGLYVNNVSTGALFKIRIEPSGEPGEVVAITVTPPLMGPDGMRVLDATTLVVAEGPANRVSRITITGTTAQRTSLIDPIREPSSVTIVGDDAWIAEGQILRLVSDPPISPDLPFVVRRVPLH
ncbi:MAG TPA: hypothetical protein VIV40_12695 [Kofleriaceae bacterium]